MAHSRACCWPECVRPVWVPDLPICLHHALKVNSRVGEEARADSRAKAATAPLPVPATSVIYYVRIGDHVKIGTSTNVASRLRSFYIEDPAALLATEAGGHALEAQRHREFAAERVRPDRELFNPSPRLLAHIATLAEQAA